MIVAVVPAKALSQAKRRLGAVLSEGERRALALAMLQDVLGALKRAPRIDSIAVVSPDADLLSVAAGLGTEALVEPPRVRGVNSALTYTLESLTPRGLDTLLVVPLDVPLIAAAEVEAIIEAIPPERGVVLCPSLARPSGRGTSALALRPPNAIPFRFGQNSFMAHHRQANAAGLPVRVLRIPSLALDIDEPGDLLDLLSRPGETLTHRLLAEMEIGRRLKPAAPLA